MRVCDRCHKDNATIELVVNKNDTLSKFVKAVESAIVWKPEPLDRFDLCPDCYKKLKQFFMETE
jgi:hypothetical protein